jgi:ammonium transporter, Amt family
MIARRAVFLALLLLSPIAWSQENRPADDANRIGAAADSAGVTKPEPDNAKSLVTLMPAILALLVPAGFALLFAGMSRAKNSAQTLALVLLMVPIAGLAFCVFGFALGWGNAAHGALPAGFAHLVHELPADAMNRGLGIASDANEPDSFAYGLIGTKGFCLSGIDDQTLLAIFFLAMTLAVVAAIIPAGALLERWAWKNCALYAIWCVVLFSLLANWIWGGGWLAQIGTNWRMGHGAVDFAGSGVIHAMAGVVALAGAICLRPRIGKYVGGRPRAMPGHSIALVVFGTLLLLVGWLGVHAIGATLSNDLPMTLVILNTTLAGFSGALGTLLYFLGMRYKPDPTLLCNGFIGGLVSIAAACPFVDPWAASLIGLLAGVLVNVSVTAWDKFGVDDPVGVISMHGVNGIWGLVALGLFANGKHGLDFNGVAGPVKGLFYGDGNQLVAQLITAAVVAVFGLAAAYALFRISHRITALRVSPDSELRGIDTGEVGTLSYPDFTLKSVTLDG